MSDVATALDLGSRAGCRASRRTVAWSAIALNFSLWGGIVIGLVRLLGD